MDLNDMLFFKTPFLSPQIKDQLISDRLCKILLNAHVFSIQLLHLLEL